MTEVMAMCCEVCGQPVQSGSTCSSCGLRLIDLALSTIIPENHLNIVELPSDDGQINGEPPNLVYDHFKVCLTPDGMPWELGRGAMGITYRATDTNLNRPVALKIINPRLISGVGGRARFLREARAAAKLHHPNIASVFHLGAEDDDCFYAMEYIAGETLEARIRRSGPVDTGVALQIVIQITEALCHAHGEHLVHRDIKPSNIMFASGDSEANGRQPAAKLIDFGLVKAWADATDVATDTLCRGYFAGTPCYASPEQLHQGQADIRSDIFSLGQCWWYMLAGSHPVPVIPSGGIAPVTADRIPKMTRMAQALPPRLRHLLDSMIAPDPSRRPPDATALLAELRMCQTHLASRNSHRRFIVPSLTLLGLLATIQLCFHPMSKASSHSPTDLVANSPEHAASARALYGEAEELRLRFTREDNDRAAQLYSEAISQAPAFADAYAGLAIARYQMVARFGEPAEELDLAAGTAQRAIDLDPKSPKGFHALAAIRLVQGRQWQSLKLLRHALELDPNYLPAMRDFSIAWCWVGQPQNGLVWAKAAAQREPSSLQAWGAAAEASAELAADAEAEKYYRRCVQMEPSWIEGYCGLVRLHLLGRDFAQAQRDCDMAASICSSSIYLETLQAQIPFLSGDDAQAETAYRKLLQANRKGLVNYHGGISYLSALGYLCQRRGSHAEADALLEEAAHLHVGGSEGPQAIYDLAAIRAIEGRKTEALSLLQQAIDSGWMDYRVTRLDPRFESLREVPAFGQMLAALGVHVGQMRQFAEQLCTRPLNLADYPVQPSAE